MEEIYKFHEARLHYDKLENQNEIHNSATPKSDSDHTVNRADLKRSQEL